MSKIGVVILATNAYFVLGIRFIKKFMHHYKGESEIKFYFFSDEDPYPYLPDDINVEYRYNKHTSWRDGTNSKFINMMSLENTDNDYIIYVDADTDISRDFNADWFLGETVGLEHFGNNTWMKEIKNYDRNSASKAYVPHNTPLYQMYYHGCLFGGAKDKIIEVCKVLRKNQIEDKKINYEPCVNDESYINQYYHYHPPSRIILLHEYMFNVSDKGGLEETRNVNLDVSSIKEEMLKHKDQVYNIKNGKLILL
jgi:hypothetical protein